MKFELNRKLKQNYAYEVNEVDGECLLNNSSFSELARYRYTVRSALQRGIFWETLARLDQIEEEMEQKSR